MDLKIAFLAAASASLLSGLPAHSSAQQTLAAQPASAASASTTMGEMDSDHDGLSDALEQRLLEQFRPQFRIGAEDCSVRPAEFRPGILKPEVQAEDGTIYGQVFPLAQAGRVEIHYYHLWRRDCGGHGHPLDAEHVSVLVAPAPSDGWRALLWYAAAHENTVCDVSQIARASTLHAEDHGATVSISPGKHASYLREALCGGGCGADRCERMQALPAGRVINLGEPGQPMNEALFISSTAWPLAGKMRNSDFPAAEVARADAQGSDDILRFHTGRHPAQGIIAHSAATEQVLAGAERDTTGALGTAGSSTGSALATGGTATDAALGTAGGRTGDAITTSGDATGNALGTAVHSTGNALALSYRKTRRALGTSAHHVGSALGATPAKPVSAGGDTKPPTDAPH